MKTYKKFLSSILVIILVLMIGGCKTNYSIIEQSFFNTNLYVATDKDITEENKQQIFSLLTDMENSLSLNKENSFINKFNLLTSGQSLQLSSLEKGVLVASKDAYSLTNGAFNPATLPLLKSWKLSSDTFDKQTVFITPPQSTEIENGLSILPYFSQLSFENDMVTKPVDNFQIDLGGIAKGYAVDQIVKMLENQDIEKGYISIGGSSIYIYSTDENLSVIHPRKSGEYILSIDKNTLTNTHLSTSGDYIRFYVGQNGERYSHIIDTKTGYPINTGFASVTVIGKSAVETDALSTALCSLTKQEFTNFVSLNLSDCKVYAVYEKEKLILTNALDGEFTLLDTNYTVEFIK